MTRSVLVTGASKGIGAAIAAMLGQQGFEIIAHYRSAIPVFPLGTTLTIAIEPVVVELRVSAFQCSIATDRVVATAVVNTYQPTARELAQVRRGAPQL